jgi:acetyltransferase
MVTQQLIHPGSIAVIGGSNDVTKPGGKVLKNLMDHSFKGTIYVVNPKETEIQGIPCHQHVNDLPRCDFAILAIAAKFCPETVEILARD